MVPPPEAPLTADCLRFERSVPSNRIREAFGGPVRQSNVENQFVDLQLHQDEPAVTLDPVDAGVEQGPGHM